MIMEHLCFVALSVILTVACAVGFILAVYGSHRNKRKAFDVGLVLMIVSYLLLIITASLAR